MSEKHKKPPPSDEESGFPFYLISWIIGRIIGLLFVFSKK